MYDSGFPSDEMVHSVTQQLVEAVSAHSTGVWEDSMVALLSYSVHPSQIRRSDILKSYKPLTVVVQVQLGQKRH